MNTHPQLVRTRPTTPTKRPVRVRGSVVLWILASLAGGFVLAAILVINALTLNREARVVREAMVGALGGRTSTRVQVSVGPLMLGSARTILSFVDDVPEEARVALRSVRAASVGVYQLKADSNRNYAGVLERADAAMARAGWTRMVGVMQPGAKKCVLIYTPASAADDGPVRLCVAVCDGRELVVVSAKAAPEELMKLVGKHSKSIRI
jgi:hypothetical protein